MWKFLKEIKSGVKICFSCHEIVSLNSEQCPHCQMKKPTLFGLSTIIKNQGNDLFLKTVIFGCIALYLLTLLNDYSNISYNPSLNLLSPSVKSLIKWGAGGYFPRTNGYWWTILSCAWLHGGLFHILFNLLWINTLISKLANLYKSPVKLIIIYTISALTGGLLSSFFTPLTVGASGALFGLFGALLSYSQIPGYRDKNIKNEALVYVMIGIIGGFITPRVDNWGHLGGFLGGFLATKLPWLQPQYRDNWSHIFLGIVCLLFSLLSILLSLIFIKVPG